MITKNLEASTAHITPGDASILDRYAEPHRVAVPPVVVYKYDEGYFIFVPEDAEDFKDTILSASREGLSQNFLDLMSCARQNKCKYVQLDADGETYPDLPTHKW